MYYLKLVIFSVTLPTAYFCYRVLIGYFNTPQKILNRVLKQKQEFVYRRANYLRRVCMCDERAARLGINTPPCDYCKGLILGEKEAEVDCVLIVSY